MKLRWGNNPFSLGYSHQQDKQLFSHYQLVSLDEDPYVDLHAGKFVTKKSVFQRVWNNLLR